jgi:hypothetical protein
MSRKQKAGGNLPTKTESATTSFIVSAVPRELLERFDRRVVRPNYGSRAAEIKRLMAERINQAERKN